MELKTARGLSGLELLLGAAVVIGHNVFRVLPNEVPVLVLLGLISMRLRDGGWAAMGLRRPPSWRRIVLIAAGAAALRIALGDYLIVPVAEQFWPPEKAPEGIDELTGNLQATLLMLLLVWGFAAFGEEIAYRGYLLTRAAQFFGSGNAAYLAATVLTAVLFGYGHYYKGPTGILDSGVAGLILGGAFLLAGRNLWACILAHGFIDTIALTLVYFGVAD